MRKIIAEMMVKLELFRHGLLRYNKINTHLVPSEKLKLYTLARSVAGNCVEIGSYEGASSCFISSGLKDSDYKLFCIDTWKNDAMSEGRRDTYDAFIENTVRLSDKIVSLRGLSTEVSEEFQQSVQFIFFDGDHSYSGVLADWNAWYPKLDKRALVVFHDIGWAEGVQRVVKDNVVPIAESDGRLPNLYWAWVIK